MDSSVLVIVLTSTLCLLFLQLQLCLQGVCGIFALSGGDCVHMPEKYPHLSSFIPYVVSYGAGSLLF